MALSQTLSLGDLPNSLPLLAIILKSVLNSALLRYFIVDIIVLYILIISSELLRCPQKTVSVFCLLFWQSDRTVTGQQAKVQIKNDVENNDGVGGYETNYFGYEGIYDRLTIGVQSRSVRGAIVEGLDF